MEMDEKRGAGRPPTKHGVYDKPRMAGRIASALWEACERQARADGQTMTDFVTAALTRELEFRRPPDASRETAGDS